MKKITVQQYVAQLEYLTQTKWSVSLVYRHRGRRSISGDIDVRKFRASSAEYECEIVERSGVVAKAELTAETNS